MIVPSSGSHRAPRVTLVWVIGLIAASVFGIVPLVTAQAPPPAPARVPVVPPQTSAPPARQVAPAAPLPVRRVVLYKSGVGYFEHLGKVRGAQNVTIDFTSGQLDDVLKSLTALDLDGGRVAGVSYNSEAALDRRLGALRLPVGQQTTRAEFLTALRGARLEVRSAATRVVGRLLSVERVERQRDNGTTHVDVVSLVSDAGEIQSIVLDPGVSVRVLEPGLAQEVGRYLSLVASARDQDLRRLTLATTGAGERDLFVSYISEVPVWKATYRLVLSTGTEARPPLLQGWAIVDNTVGEDWENVELSLVSGAPQSFVQAISRPYYVQRPVVALPDRASLSPQTHQGALGTAGLGALAGTVTDSGGSAIPGVTVRVTRAGVTIATASTDGRGRYTISNVPPGTYDLSFQLSGFNTPARPGVVVSGGMESVVNAMMAVGSMAEGRVGGVVGGVVGGIPSPAPPPPPAPAGGGRGGGGGGGGGGVNRSSTVSGLGSSSVNITMDSVTPRLDSVEEARLAQQAQASAGQLGDLFEYKLREPVTIRKNQSALVPILSGAVSADKVSLWNAATSASRPLRAVWLTNTTSLTLDGGSFSVIEGQAFAGEGLMESLKAGERRLLSYAADLGLMVDAKGETVPARITKVQINRGVLIQQTEEKQRRTYTARNEDTEPRVLVLEHPARAGWTIGGTVAPSETTPAWHRFRVPIAAKTTATFTVEEVRPVSAQYSISSITDDQIALLVRDRAIDATVEAALREVGRRKAEIARLGAQIGERRLEIENIDRDQARVRENMRSLKGSAEEKQLLQRYVKQLDDQETRLAVLHREQQALEAERQKAQADLDAFILGLTAG